MSDDELKSLDDSYEKSGLLFPIVVFEDSSGEARGEKGPWPKYLLAGRNRLEMLKRRGVEDPRDAKIAGGNFYGAIQEVQAIRKQGYLRLADGSETKNWVVETDPELYVLATDVHRRQLTAEEKREAIEAYFERAPRASNRKVGNDLGVSPTTAGKVRKKMSVPNVQTGQMEPSKEHLPIERAKAAVRANPSDSVSEIVEKTGVGRATVQRAMKLVAAESNSEPQPEPQPVDPERERQKKVDRFRATVQKTFVSWTKQWLDEIGLAAMQNVIKVEARAWRDNTAALSR